ncbi:hypothetical protein [Candidatus Enterovibrio escicola]|uniref:hypothetical protein n=1 Tax=Candidatus Enterovibrio escicola TaxID=1927127 RepID=UPI001681C020|nr:hypothetical protein [Candidatus Enterovibrio escacola]
MTEIERYLERVWFEFPTKKSKKIFLAKFKSWLQARNEPVDEFINILCQHIKTRMGNQQFGFNKLHLTTYLNQERWSNDYESNRPRTDKTSHQQNRYEQHNAVLLKRYCHSSAPSRRSIGSVKRGGLDPNEMCGGLLVTFCGKSMYGYQAYRSLFLWADKRLSILITLSIK